MIRKAAITNAMEQMEAITNGTHINRPVSVVMRGEGAEAPAFLDYELEQIIGRPVKVEWRQIKRPEVTLQPSTGVVKDGYSEYYESAYRRGANTGD